MKRLITSPRADADLKHIHRYIAQDNPQAARKQVAAIRKRFKLLTEVAQAGESVEHYGHGIRRFVVDNYVIYFHSKIDTIEIVRVLHGAQDADEQVF